MCGYLSGFPMAGCGVTMDTAHEGMSPNEYMLLHNFCAVCHWPAQRRGRWMELHHIVGGSGRKDVEINYLCLCLSLIHI